MYEQLAKIGLEESEAQVYVALLELGPATVTQITKKAGITRTFGYKILDKLGLWGLVSQAGGEGKVRRYAAEHPQSLRQFVANQANNWQRRAERIGELLPDLVALYRTCEKPVIRYQEGAAGVKAMFEETLESRQEILSVLDVESWTAPEFWEWAKWYNRERNKRKIKERILILDTPKGREWIGRYYVTPYTVYRWLAPEAVPELLYFGGEMNVCGGKVVIAILKKPQCLAVVIESTVLANIIRALFEKTWNTAEPVRFRKRPKK